jgi:hypothetical protein
MERSGLELCYVLRAALATGGNGLNDYNCRDARNARNACCGEMLSHCLHSDPCSRVAATLCVIISCLTARFELVYSPYTWFELS